MNVTNVLSDASVFTHRGRGNLRMTAVKAPSWKRGQRRHRRQKESESEGEGEREREREREDEDVSLGGGRV